MPDAAFEIAFNDIADFCLTPDSIRFDEPRWCELLACAIGYADAILIMVTKWKDSKFASELLATLQLMRVRAVAFGWADVVEKIDQSLLLLQ